MTPKDSSTKKPAAIERAVCFLYLHVATGVAGFFWEWFVFKDSLFKQTDPFGPFLFLIIESLFMLWLTWKIDEGFNWARIAYLVLFFIGIPFYLIGLLRFFPYSIVLNGLSLAGCTMDVAAVIMLFSRDARLWFNSLKADASVMSEKVEPNA